MVTVNTKLAHKPDRGDWRDHIEGLVQLPADHVYGKTALSQQEWHKLAHKHRSEQYVVVLQMPGLPRRVDSLPKPYAEAMGDFGYGVWAKRSWYTPGTGARLSVMAESEWQRAKAIDEAAQRIASLRSAEDLERLGEQR